MEMEKNFNPQALEGELYQAWESAGAFTAHRVEGKKPFTIVMHRPTSPASCTWAMLWTARCRTRLSVTTA